MTNSNGTRVRKADWECVSKLAGAATKRVEGGRIIMETAYTFDITPDGEVIFKDEEVE
jgi:hypothetical protein